MLQMVSLHRKTGTQFALNDGRDRTNRQTIHHDIKSHCSMAWLLRKNTCNNQHIIKSNKVKVQENGTKVTSLQVKSTLALKYFVTLKKYLNVT